MTTHDPYVALRSSTFVRFLCAHFLDILGLQMATTALGWELYERTASPFVLGMIGFMQFLPVLLLSIPLGHLIDMRSRKPLLLFSELCMTTGALGLLTTSFWEAPVPMVYAFVALIGFASTISLPARAAFYPQLMPKSRLHNAVTWSNNSRQTATVLGPVIGGLTIALSGHARWAYAAHVVCCLIYIMLIASIKLTERVAPQERLTWKTLFTGLHFILRTRLIFATITLDLVAVLFGGATALLPIFAKDILQIGPVGLGWLRTAPAIGSIAMSLIIAYRPPMQRAGVTMLWAVAGYGISMIIFGISKNPFLSFAMLCLGGGLDAISVIIRHTLLQLLTPPHMLGRVYAVNSLFGISSNELGNFESGVAAQLLGAVTSVAVGGVVSVLSVLAAMGLWPEIAKLRALHTEKTAEEGKSIDARPEGMRA